jgi:hypothetical protein
LIANSKEEPATSLAICLDEDQDFPLAGGLIDKSCPSLTEKPPDLDELAAFLDGAIR